MAPQARPGAAETTTVPIVVLDEQKKKADKSSVLYQTCSVSNK